MFRNFSDRVQYVVETSWNRPWILISFVLPLVLICFIPHEILETMRELMENTDAEKYAFQVKWNDPVSSLTHEFVLTYFTRDGSVEMYDTRKHKIFLRRTKCLDCNLQDFQLSEKVTIFSRQLEITDYADDFTRVRLSLLNERTFAMIKPDAIDQCGAIMNDISARGLRISKARMIQLTVPAAKEFYIEHAQQDFYKDLIAYVTEGRVLALELTGEAAVHKWREILGPTDPEKAKIEAPNSIRAKYGKDKTRNAAHGSDSMHSAKRELSLLFPEKLSSLPWQMRTSAVLQNTTCCVILPHAVHGGNAGAIIMDIQEMGFNVTALEMRTLSKREVEEFLEVYKGVVPEYYQMVSHMCSGPLIALEVGVTGSSGITDLVSQLRDLAGPRDPEVGKKIRPHTLRAKYGLTKVEKGVHCTDLPEDAALEVEYFFSVLLQ